MITTALIKMSDYILSIIFGFLPASSGFSSEFTTAFTQIGGYMILIDTIVPLAVLAQCLTLVIAFELIVFSFKGLRFLVSYMPIFGGRG